MEPTPGEGMAVWEDLAAEDEDRPWPPSGRRNLANCPRKEPRSRRERGSREWSLVGTWTLAEGPGPRTCSHHHHTRHHSHSPVREKSLARDWAREAT